MADTKKKSTEKTKKETENEKARVLNQQKSSGSKKKNSTSKPAADSTVKPEGTGASSKDEVSKDDIKDLKTVLKDLTDAGREKGMLTYREIEDAFEKVDITPEQIEKVYETLEKIGIEIVAEIIEEDLEDFQFTENDDEEEEEEERALK